MFLVENKRELKSRLLTIETKRVRLLRTKIAMDEASAVEVFEGRRELNEPVEDVHSRRLLPADSQSCQILGQIAVLVAKG